ncbi:TPA: hypothetical protein NJY08_004848 [Salmonella enterica subsp. enterica serovar Typhi str. AG3]|nr:hypothetical protein [Salmonella enterica subsp. enterica serovar Typhi str. AG3]
MYKLNKTIIDSPIFESFISKGENEKLYLSYLEEPSYSKKEKLDEAFTTYTKQKLAISYLKKMIYFESRRFDKKRREFESKQPLILNAPTEENITLQDMIADENSENEFQLAFEVSIEDVITDSALMNAVQELSERQSEILYLSYVLNWSDKMIANRYNVSQQAINKSRRKTLNKLREALK